MIDLQEHYTRPTLQGRSLALRRQLLMLSFLVAAALAGLGVASAQDAQRPLGSLLPDTTIAAFHFSPSSSGHAFLEALAGDLDLEAAGATVAKLARLIGDEFDDELGDLFDSGMHGLMDESFAEMTQELAASCPALADSLTEETFEALLGPTVVAVSMSRFNPMPGVLLVSRPADLVLADGLYDALVSCYDAGVSLKQDGVDLHLFADGSDQPLLVARVDGAFLASTDQDLLRSSVRLALGSTEPSHISHRVGSLAAGPMSRGFGMTVDLAALADALDGLRGFLPQEAPYTSVIDRVLASLRVVNGVAVSARVDDAGLVFESLVSVDEEAADVTGETALLELLTCAGCDTGGLELIPTGAAGVWAGTFSPTQFVAWLDTWLADLQELGVGDLDTRSLVSEYLGVDLDEVLLDWVGTGWHTAQLDVYDTDVRSWLNSPATVMLVPVTDEAAARRGVAQWQGLVRGFTGLGESLFADYADLPSEYSDEAQAALASIDMLSVRPGTYRGVSYERWRYGPVSDSAVAVIGGYLVVAMPASTIEDVIDVYLGAPGIAADPRLGPLLAGQPAGAGAYTVVDVPRYLNGFAAIADLASAPLATGLQVAVAAALQRDAESAGVAIDPADVPTFDELLSLTDLGTKALTALAARTGTAVGTTESVGGVIWTTWRLPLKQ